MEQQKRTVRPLRLTDDEAAPIINIAAAETEGQFTMAVRKLLVEALAARERLNWNFMNGYEWSIRPPDFDPDIWPTYIASETEARSKLANYENWDLMRRPRTVAVGEWEIVDRREASQKEDRGREVGA